MALPASGVLGIIQGVGVSSDRSISLEVDGNETPPKDLVGLGSRAGLSAPVSMSDFYGYSSCSAAPQPVTDADANVVSDDVTITWTPHTLGEDAEQFRIERNPQSTGVWSFVANVAVGTGDSYTDNDLPSDQYLYRVRAENSCGNSSYVNTNSVIVP